MGKKTPLVALKEAPKHCTVRLDPAGFERLCTLQEAIGHRGWAAFGIKRTDAPIRATVIAAALDVLARGEVETRRAR